MPSQRKGKHRRSAKVEGHICVIPLGSSSRNATPPKKKGRKKWDPSPPPKKKEKKGIFFQGPRPPKKSDFVFGFPLTPTKKERKKRDAPELIATKTGCQPTYRDFTEATGQCWTGWPPMFHVFLAFVPLPLLYANSTRPLLHQLCAFALMCASRSPAIGPK